MLNYNEIVNHINECILAEYEMLQDEEKEEIKGANDIVKGFRNFYQMFLDSLGTYDNSFMDFWKFREFNNKSIIFETDHENQLEQLKKFGVDINKICDVETTYYRIVFPVFSIMYSDFLANDL
jgi:hypothetical protein